MSDAVHNNALRVTSKHGIFGVPKSAILDELERVILTSQKLGYVADRDKQRKLWVC